MIYKITLTNQDGQEVTREYNHTMLEYYQKAESIGNAIIDMYKTIEESKEEKF